MDLKYSIRIDGNFYNIRKVQKLLTEEFIDDISIRYQNTNEIEFDIDKDDDFSDVFSQCKNMFRRIREVSDNSVDIWVKYPEFEEEENGCVKCGKSECDRFCKICTVCLSYKCDRSCEYYSKY